MRNAPLLRTCTLTSQASLPTAARVHSTSNQHSRADPAAVSLPAPAPSEASASRASRGARAVLRAAAANSNSPQDSLHNRTAATPNPLPAQRTRQPHAEHNAYKHVPGQLLLAQRASSASSKQASPCPPPPPPSGSRPLSFHMQFPVNFTY